VPARNGSGIALLADPTRRRIVALCAGRALRPSVIARRLGVSRPTATRQLRLLTEAGLLVRRPSPIDGRSVVYLLNPSRVGPIIAWLAATEVAWDGSEGDPPIV